jgi:phage/conjugal plasmid C-4 type zinc finger TraR family protein
MEISNKERKHIISLVNGDQKPISGMEIHFLKVVAGQGCACTPKEKRWFSFWREYVRTKTVDPPKQRKRKAAPLPEAGLKDAETWRSFKQEAADLPKPRKKRRSKRVKISQEHAVTTISHPIKNSTRLCCDCGEPIPVKRLEANPDAGRCVECQMEFEGRNPHIASRKADEGIAGSREDHKKLRARDWGAMINRYK